MESASPGRELRVVLNMGDVVIDECATDRVLIEQRYPKRTDS
jgi:hypothetical protein